MTYNEEEYVKLRKKIFKLQNALSDIKEIVDDGWGGGINEQAAQEKLQDIINKVLGELR